MFWKDNWCQEQTFDLYFPRLFNLSNIPNTCIADIFQGSNDNKANQDIGFRRGGGLNDREIEELHSLLQMLSSFSPNSSLHDRRVRLLDPVGISCRSYFDALVGSVGSPNFKPFRFIWKSCVTYNRTKVFAWLVFHNKINTSNLVQKRNPHMALSPSCYVMCMENGFEDLFEKIKFSAALWASIDKAFKDIPLQLIILNWQRM